MNLYSAYLALLAFALFPKVVRASDWGLQTLIDELEAPSSIFAETPFFVDSSSFSSMMHRHQQLMEQALFGGMPSFTPAQQQYSIEVDNTPQRFELKVHLPSGLSPADLKVDLDQRTRQLTIAGHYEYTNEETGHLFSSDFSRTFALDPFVQVDQLEATAGEDGVLVVSAPKTVVQETVRSIPVTKALEIGAAPTEEEEEPVEEEEAPPVRQAKEEEEETADSFDPFRIKERVHKTLLRNDNATLKNKNNNPNKRLDDTYSGYKTSELRRRRR